MELQTIQAQSRPATGGGEARRSRAAGAVPCVLYGGDGEPAHLLLDHKRFDKLVTDVGAHAVLQLDVTDQPALSGPIQIKEIQRHPVRERIVHADFLRIRLDEKITTSVEVEVIGQSRGVVEGGILDQMLYELEIECLALEVPERIDVDVTELGIGDSVHVSDLKLDANLTIITDPERVVVAVHAPRVVSLEPEVSETPTEPEIAGKEGSEEEK